MKKREINDCVLEDKIVKKREINDGQTQQDELVRCLSECFCKKDILNNKSLLIDTTVFINFH